MRSAGPIAKLFRLKQDVAKTTQAMDITIFFISCSRWIRVDPIIADVDR